MLKERLMADLKEAMKEKDVLRKNVVQMIRAAILQVEKDKQIELEDNQIIEIIAKESKKRKDSLYLQAEVCGYDANSSKSRKEFGKIKDFKYRDKISVS